MNTEVSVHQDSCGDQKHIEEEYLNSLLNTVNDNDEILNVNLTATVEKIVKPVPVDIDKVNKQDAVDVQVDTVVVETNDIAERVPEKVGLKVNKVEPNNTMANPISEQSAVNSESEFPFMCQLFTCLGLKLGLPLSTFSRVIPWPDALSPVTGAAEHIVGVCHSNENDYEVIDIGGLIVPTRRQEALSNAVKKNYSHIVLLMDGRTGIACESCEDTIVVKPKNVCWRSEQSQRLWLAGTVKQGGFALLDIDGVMGLLS